MLFVRLGLVVGSLALVGAILWAMDGSGPFGEEVAWLISRPWGVVSLIDLYLCFAALSVVVWMVEKNKAVAVAVILPTFVLGGLIPALWMAWRLPDFARQLARP